MLHSVVQGHFLCDRCLLCIRTWDALYIACGLVKKWVLLRKLGSHRSTSKSQGFPDLCVPHKERFETRGLCWLHTVNLCSRTRILPLFSVALPSYGSSANQRLQWGLLTDNWGTVPFTGAVQESQLPKTYRH